MVSFRTETTRCVEVTPAPLMRTSSECSTTVVHCCSASGLASSAGSTSETIEFTAFRLWVMTMRSVFCPSGPSSRNGSAS